MFSCFSTTPQDSALVLCACNAVQLLQRSQLPFSWTMAHKSPKLNALVTRFRESYSSASMSRESKRLKKSSSNWLNSANALTHRVKNASFLFPVLPGSAEAQVIWGGLVNVFWSLTLSVASLPKNINIRSRMSKLWQGRGVTFFETQCIIALYITVAFTLRSGVDFNGWATRVVGLHLDPVHFLVIGSRPSDHYFRSVCLFVCLFVCLCRLFVSRLWSDFD